MEVPKENQGDSWILNTDGASSSEGSGAGLVLVDPSGIELTYALRLNFPSTNNEAEYEALLAGLRMAREMKVEKLEVRIDSLLVVNQMKGEYEAKGKKMKKYLREVNQLVKQFKKCQVSHVPRSKNKKADALSKLASLTFAHLTKKVLVEVLEKSSIEEREVKDVVIEEETSWMTPIADFLSKGKLPENKDEAWRLKAKAKQYVIQDGVLYKKAYLAPLLRCVGSIQSNYLIREIHMGMCGNHAGPRAVVSKIMNLGYYWPTMHNDAQEEIKKCEACQIHSPIQHSPKENLVPIMAAWPFHKWGMDIVGPFPEGKGKVKFLLVAVDYFTKWPEVKPLARITGEQVIEFV